MKLEKIANIETSTYSDVADKYLSCGWKLLHVGDIKSEDSACVVYVLGWPKKNGEPIHPKEARDDREEFF